MEGEPVPHAPRNTESLKSLQGLGAAVEKDDTFVEFADLTNEELMQHFRMESPEILGKDEEASRCANNSEDRGGKDVMGVYRRGTMRNTELNH